MAPCNISSDVLFEILSRVELKTLRRCRTLSRECYNLTYESNFMQLHCQRTKTIAGYFFQSLVSNRYHSTFLSVDNPGLDHELLSLNFLPERFVQILATVNQGLMFCVGQGPQHHYYICKPSTKQWEIIPSPNPRFFTRKMGMVVLKSDPLRFKIVRISDGVCDLEPEYDSQLDIDYYKRELTDRVYKHFQTEVFDSDIWAWKELDDLMLSYYELFNTKPAISAYGGLHWHIDNKQKHNILSFYGDKERWVLVSSPDSLCDRYRYRYINLVEYAGSLAFICMKPGFNSLDLWVLKGQKLWTKPYTINLSGDIGYYVESFYNADTLLMTDMFRATFYNFKNGEFNRLELPINHVRTESAFFIQTDYEPTSYHIYCLNPSRMQDWLREDLCQY
ncbi:hypothetical protein REPUB_Repub18cG0115700 [Reevesia pubescens]